MKKYIFVYAFDGCMEFGITSFDCVCFDENSQEFKEFVENFYLKIKDVKSFSIKGEMKKIFLKQNKEDIYSINDLKIVIIDDDKSKVLNFEESIELVKLNAKDLIKKINDSEIEYKKYLKDSEKEKRKKQFEELKKEFE